MTVVDGSVYYLCSFAAKNHRCQLALVNTACHDHHTTMSLAVSLLRMRTEVVTSSCQRDVDVDYVRDDDDDDNDGKYCYLFFKFRILILRSRAF